MHARFAVIVLASSLLAAAFAPRPSLADWPPFGRALTTAPGDQLGPVIATDGAGGAIVAWQDRRLNFNIDAEHVSATGIVDVAWPANGRALLSDALAQSAFAQGPAIASDGAGGAIVTW